MCGPTLVRTWLVSTLALHALGACGGELGRDQIGASGGSAGLAASPGGSGGSAGLAASPGGSGGSAGLAASPGGSGGMAGSPTGGATGGATTGGSDCATKLDRYYAAVRAAMRCDPEAAEPCTAYSGVECPPVGVNPDNVAALSIELTDFKAAGCALPLHSCPILVITPAPYTCQAGEDAVYACRSLCEQTMGGRATCVSQSKGCPGVAVPVGFCSGTAMICCAPY